MNQPDDYYIQFIYEPKREAAIAFLNKIRVPFSWQMTAIASEFLRINDPQCFSDSETDNESDSE